jgi:hypothetical protein
MDRAVWVTWMAGGARGQRPKGDFPGLWLLLLKGGDFMWLKGSHQRKKFMEGVF